MRYSKLRLVELAAFHFLQVRVYLLSLGTFLLGLGFDGCEVWYFRERGMEGACRILIRFGGKPSGNMLLCSHSGLKIIMAR